VVRNCRDRQIHMGKQTPANMETPTARTQTDKKKHLRQTNASVNRKPAHIYYPNALYMRNKDTYYTTKNKTSYPQTYSAQKKESNVSPNSSQKRMHSPTATTYDPRTFFSALITYHSERPQKHRIQRTPPQYYAYKTPLLNPIR
jgi:hypothetical protein